MKCPKCGRSYMVVDRFNGKMYLHPRLYDFYGRKMNSVYQCLDALKYFDIE